MSPPFRHDRRVHAVDEEFFAGLARDALVGDAFGDLRHLEGVDTCVAVRAFGVVT